MNRNVNLNQHILCEASAGTGKTFTIEHLFIRRLLTAPKRPVKEIAVLTFTNAVA
ncbi:MAG: UvrD-helicase domain-containing protein, partial [Verrucomicrobia bacterium]|nr:UvrD-helicase domain-containing protein [Verrucomicrobiota bacterium]